MPVEGVTSLRELGQRMGEVGGTLTDQNIMAGIGSYVEGATLDRMEQAIAPDGTPHKPLSKRWLNFKRTGINSENPEAWIAELKRRRSKRRSINAVRRNRSKRGWKRPGALKTASSVEQRYNLGKGTRKGWKARSDKIWIYTGQSMRKLQTVKVTRTSCVVRINTPYSGYANAERPVLGLSARDREVLGGGIVADLAARVEGIADAATPGSSGEVPDGG